MSRIETPECLRKEHEELHAELVEATRAGGATGEAAQAVARLMHPHFVKEEKYAMPPLGLLAALAAGQLESSMRDVLPLAGELKTELPRMLEEHKAIVAALDNLTAAATKERKPRYADFAAKLIHHARTEEEIMYPAAVLVGEYVKSKLGE